MDKKIEKKKVAIGLVGTKLDAGQKAERWNRWRPSVDICSQEELLFDRFELLYSGRADRLAELLQADIQSVSPETEVRPQRIPMRSPWDFEDVFDVLYEFARKYPFDPEREEYFVHLTTGSHVAQICWFLLAESRHVPARLLQSAPPRRGANRGSVSIIDLDLSTYDRIARRFETEQREALSFLKSGIDTRNERFNGLMERIEIVAIQSEAPILLTGPTGAGKSRLARRLFELKADRRRVSGPFVEVNCATLRGDAGMSALFGHRRGAFTGAVADRPGLLKAADGGVLFLDELAELGLDEQAMLLRALEEKRFLPVGADREIESDFQLIGGTNRDLKRAVEEGAFREDLLARLNLWTFAMPGLSERREDIEPNVDYELERLTRETGRKITFNRQAREAFLAFALSPQASWNANFRDLSAALTRMGTLALGGRITVEEVRDEVDRLRTGWAAPLRVAAESRVSQVLGDAATDLDRFDLVQLEEVLAVCSESRSLSEAGRTLFAESRKKKRSANDADRLSKYLSRFGLDWKGVQALDT